MRRQRLRVCRTTRRWQARRTAGTMRWRWCRATSITTRGSRMSQAERNEAAEDRVRHGRILREAQSDVRRGDWVQWSWPGELHLGLVIRTARKGAEAHVWHASSLLMHQVGSPPKACRTVYRIRTRTMQIIWEAPRA